MIDIRIHRRYYYSKNILGKYKKKPYYISNTLEYKDKDNLWNPLEIHTSNIYEGDK